MTTSTVIDGRRRIKVTPGRVLLYGFLIATSIVWLLPLIGAVYASFRPFADTVQHGAFSIPREALTLDNYRHAWTQSDIPRKYWNTALILVPALTFTLFGQHLLNDLGALPDADIQASLATVSRDRGGQQTATYASGPSAAPRRPTPARR